MTRGVGGQSPSNIAQYLSGIDFPCQRDDLVRHAKNNNAEEPVIDALENLPDREYTTMADVMEGFGESRRS